MYLVNVELFEKLNGTRDNTFRALLGGLKSVQDNPWNGINNIFSKERPWHILGYTIFISLAWCTHWYFPNYSSFTINSNVVKLLL